MQNLSYAYLIPVYLVPVLLIADVIPGHAGTRWLLAAFALIALADGIFIRTLENNVLQAIKVNHSLVQENDRLLAEIRAMTEKREFDPPYTLPNNSTGEPA